jgi:alcohol dehydrogenase YqhD (iron-dependent ADH family)
MVYGKGAVFKNGAHQDVLGQAKEAGVSVVEYGGCPPNPGLEFVAAGVALAIKENVQLVLAVGGGSAIDAAKAIALFARNADVDDLWQHMVSKKDLKHKALPIGVVLTSFGTGSEGNGSFVISNQRLKEKLGQSDLSTRPSFAICDPRYTATLGKGQVALGSVDIISHLLEQYFCLEGENLFNDLIVAALRNVATNALRATSNDEDLDARAELMMGSTLALSYVFSLGKTLDWTSHKIEHALSGVYDVPHAAGLACIFPAWLQLASAQPVIKEKLERLAVALGLGHADEAGLSEATIAYLKGLFRQLGLTVSLTDLLGFAPDHAAVADVAMKYGEFGRIFPINRQRCLEILQAAD